MSDWAINLETGAPIIRNGDFTIATGGAAVAQRVWLRLQTDRGEWQWDILEGLPYTQEILGSSDQEAIRARVVSVLLDDDEADALAGLRLTFDRITRKLTINEAILRTVYGEVSIRDVQLGDG